LTSEGEAGVREEAEKFKQKGPKIDLIISSPFERTRQTAEIYAEVLGIKKEEIVFDERLKE